ncbi:RNAse H domain protein, YqgF family [Eubacterium saphenum ATCC 49989]|nr:RNAse H domain protein, YqgF family [Eubacterium saphenum ATCC 49989]
MRVLALDVGEATIGVARSDALGITAQGLLSIFRESIKKDTTKIIDILREDDYSEIVIGMPLNTYGEAKNEQSIFTEKFADKLQNKLRSSGMSNIKVEFYDERFTTKMARDVLIQGGIKGKKQKDVIDKQAAVILLQSYLDKKSYRDER